jgi:hypothetical protein
VFSARLICGTPLSFPINGGSGRAGNRANSGTGLRSSAPPKESANHRSAHTATHRSAAPPLSHGIQWADVADL